MNVPYPSSADYGLRERLRSAESRLRAADTLARAARACLAAPDRTHLRELGVALDRYDRPLLLGAPGRLLTDHRLAGAPTRARLSDRPSTSPATVPREPRLAAVAAGDRS